MAVHRAKKTVTEKVSSGKLFLPSAAITLNVLGYEEDGEWAALALEMDLRGYGATFDDALADLADLVAMQISFAFYKEEPEMIWKPAEPVWFERFEDVRRHKVRTLLHQAGVSFETQFDVAALPIPPALVIESLKASFSEV